MMQLSLIVLVMHDLEGFWFLDIVGPWYCPENKVSTFFSQSYSRLIFIKQKALAYLVA